MNPLIDCHRRPEKETCLMLVEDPRESVCSGSPLGAILLQMKAWDEHLYRHARLTARLAVRAGETLQLSREDRFYLITGALLHDVGKIFWPKEMSFKPRLTAADLEWVRDHPENGYRHVQARWPGVPGATLDIIRQHHERPDGSGYPLGLTGRQIHPLATVVGAIEAYAAMTEARAYRQHRLSPPEALRELLQGGHPARLVDLIQNWV